MHNQMAMMEAQGRHETFVTSAQNLKKDERRELQKFKDQNQRLICRGGASREHDFNAESSIGGAISTNMPPSNKASSLAGNASGLSHSRLEKKRNQKHKGGATSNN